MPIGIGDGCFGTGGRGGYLRAPAHYCPFSWLTISHACIILICCRCRKVLPRPQMVTWYKTSRRYFWRMNLMDFFRCLSSVTRQPGFVLPKTSARRDSFFQKPLRDDFCTRLQSAAGGILRPRLQVWNLHACGMLTRESGPRARRRPEIPPKIRLKLQH